jgi:hypothetical protein
MRAGLERGNDGGRYLRHGFVRSTSKYKLHTLSTLPYDKSNPAFALIACSSFARITDSLVYCGSYDHIVSPISGTKHEQRAHLEQIYASAGGGQSALVCACVLNGELREEFFEAAVPYVSKVAVYGYNMATYSRGGRLQLVTNLSSFRRSSWPNEATT